MHSWHLHHRHQQQHNLTGQHACIHLAHAALCAWWHVWQQPTHSDGFDFELLMKPTAPPALLMLNEQLTPGHSKWRAAAQDITLTTLTCHTPAPHTPIAHMSHDDNALSACKTATCSTATLTSPLTPMPLMLHNNTLLAHANAEHATTDHCILQCIVD